MSFPERIRYGAVELRRFYNRHLFAALGISIALHLALIGLYLTSTDAVIAGNDLTPIERPNGPTILENIEPPKTNKPTGIQSEPGPSTPAHVTPMGPTDVPLQNGTTARSGDPVPVDDSKLSPDEGKFASKDQLGTSSPDGKGDGGSPNGTLDNGGGVPRQGGGDSATKPALIADEIPNEFPDPDVMLPDVNLEDITKKAPYPALARQNGIEGKVTVKVLIDEEGRPVRTSIEMGANILLDSAAIRAVRATRFQPATLNGTPVKAWLFLPINFTLD